jgi:putative Holliday junction resolvase
VVALDFGKARVGLAVSDELEAFAHPRPPLDGHNRKKLLEDLVRLAKELPVDRFLLGLPLDALGAEGPAASRATAFAQQLADATGVEVELVDERLSTVEAERQLRASGVSSRDMKARVDGVAAALLLQAWLDARRPGSA